MRVQEVMTEGLTTALAGLALGSIGAYVVGRAMQGMWYGVGTMEMASFTVVATMLLVSALLACFVPGRRAASVDPMESLRHE